MKYTFEKKLLVISEAKSGKPIEWLSRKYRIDKKAIQIWIGLYEKYGESGLRKLANVDASPQLKETLVRLFLEKAIPLSQILIDYRISRAAMQRWVRIVRKAGYQSLHIVRPKGRPPKDMGRPKKKEPQTELEKLHAENVRLRAENALLKKVKSLVEEQEARARLNGQQPSKS